jgi:hypothetical protein
VFSVDEKVASEIIHMLIKVSHVGVFSKSDCRNGIKVRNVLMRLISLGCRNNWKHNCGNKSLLLFILLK